MHTRAGPSLRRRTGAVPAALALAALAWAGGALAAGHPEFELTAAGADLVRYFPTYLANGYFSARSSIRGTDPTESYAVGVMDYSPGDISRPAALPDWNGIDYFDGEHWLSQTPADAEHLRDYRQTLDMFDGTLTTEYRWQSSGRVTRIQVESFVSESRSGLAVVRFTFIPEFDGVVKLSLPLARHPAPAQRFPLGRLTEAAMIEAVRASGELLVAAAPATADRHAIWYPGEVDVERVGERVGERGDRVVWLRGRARNGLPVAIAVATALEPAGGARETVAQWATGATTEITLPVRRTIAYTLTKYVALERPGVAMPAGTIATAEEARAIGFERLRTEHAAAWHSLWQADIVIDGDPAIQRIVRSHLFYLFENTTSDTAWPVMACGFSPGYAGHTFWDSDSWVFPALLLLHPERARSLVAFRARTLDEARARASAHGYQGAMYPWESDPERGTDETPAFAWHAPEREVHVNADVAIAAWQYYLATGDLAWLRREGWPVIRAVADFWRSRVTRNEAAARYEVLHVVSPDEDYTDVANDTFTNGAARKALEIAGRAAVVVGATPDPAWADIASKIYLPESTDGRRHLDFDPSVPHDKRTWMGSTLAWLAYPSLDLPMTPERRRADFDYQLQAFDRNASDPNDMLTVMLAVEAAELGDGAAAYRWLTAATDGYLKPPFQVQSETVKNHVGYLLAPSGGFIQSLAYGLTGLRIDEAGLSAHYEPVLPPAWRSLTLNRVVFRGEAFRVTVHREASGVRIDRTRLAR